MRRRIYVETSMPEEFTRKLFAEPFPVRGYQRIAVKVVDLYGNESTGVRALS